MPAQTQKAAPPPAPPAPPKASDATAATRSLIREIASQRSRQTTVLTRRRDKLTPGSMDWPTNQNSGTALTQPLTPIANPSPNPVFTPPLAGQPILDSGFASPDYGGPTPSPTGGVYTGANDWLDNLNPVNPLSPTFGGESPFFPTPPAVDDHTEEYTPHLSYLL